MKTASISCNWIWTYSAWWFRVEFQLVMNFCADCRFAGVQTFPCGDLGMGPNGLRWQRGSQGGTALRVTPSLQIRADKGGWQCSATWARSLLSMLENERCNCRESAPKPGIDWHEAEVIAAWEELWSECCFLLEFHFLSFFFFPLTTLWIKTLLSLLSLGMHKTSLK